jgi:chemotaxis protein methyltransferase CheR
MDALELDLGDREYGAIRGLLKARTGIDLSDDKRALVYSRLYRRLRELELTSFSEYLDLVQADPEEGGRFVSALTTNVTDFFRERYHFEALQRLAPQLARKRERLTMWSSACSTGEEPWSIAVTMHCLPTPVPWRLLATDIDAQVLAAAKAGVYPIERLRQVPPELVPRCFLRDPLNFKARVRDELRGPVSFGQLNLLEPWPMRGQFDVIFCRNVLIYFDPATRAQVVERLASQLSPGGYLMLGHSEAMLGATDRLEPMGKTIFRRPGGPP